MLKKLEDLNTYELAVLNDEGVWQSFKDENNGL